MSLGNIFFLDNEWRELLKAIRLAEQNSVDKQVLELAFERHIRTQLGQDVDFSELQKAFIPGYIKEVQKAFPNATPQELARLTDTHLETLDSLAASFVERSFTIQEIFFHQLEKAMMDNVERIFVSAGDKVSEFEKGLDAKIDAKLAAYPIEKEKAIRASLGDSDMVIHRSDLIRHLTKKGEREVTEKEVRELYGLN